MNIAINGENREIDDGTTVAILLKGLALTGPVAVELNQEICPKKSHAKTTLSPNDTVEVVTIVGGR